VKTNSVAYELYLGIINNLRAQKAEEVNRVLAQTLKSKSTERWQFWTIAISCLSDPSPADTRKSRNEELSQATKGDDSVTWMGRVK
jgi:hypothetical protein